MRSETVIRGGKAVYGAPLGILMLEARFPRIPGDMGNALTWPFPVLYRTVPNASPDRVVRRRAEGLLPAFIDAGRDLVRQGAEGITTNCGFLSIFQRELAAALDVPVAASSLMQAPLIAALLPPGRTMGILTIARAALTPEHLRAAGIPPETPIEGTDEGREFTRAILDDARELDIEAAAQDILEAGERLLTRAPETGAILLECTNMNPYAARLQAHLGLPVFDIVSFVTWFQAGLRPRPYAAPDPGWR